MKKLNWVIVCAALGVACLLASAGTLAWLSAGLRF
jgi:hypothetical protein